MSSIITDVTPSVSVTYRVDNHELIGLWVGQTLVNLKPEEAESLAGALMAASLYNQPHRNGSRVRWSAHHD